MPNGEKKGGPLIKSKDPEKKSFREKGRTATGGKKAGKSTRQTGGNKANDPKKRTWGERGNTALRHGKKKKRGEGNKNLKNLNGADKKQKRKNGTNQGGCPIQPKNKKTTGRGGGARLLGKEPCVIHTGCS